MDGEVPDDPEKAHILHDALEAERTAYIEKTIDKLKGLQMDMPSIENIFKPGSGSTGGDMGLGGGGVLGLVALLALLNRGGLGTGAGDVAGAGVNQLTLGQIQQTLGDIKASVPYAESQMQLALAGAQMALSNTITDSTGNVIAAVGSGNSAIMNNLNMQALANANGFSGNLLATKEATILAERNSWALNQAITGDGDKTRALIQGIDKSNDSRLITTQANEIVELRQERNRSEDRHGIEISMTNNQNQNQLQFQQQQQYLHTLANGLTDAIQNIQATNQAINIGSGRQTANPLNNNTNVRA